MCSDDFFLLLLFLIQFTTREIEESKGNVMGAKRTKDRGTRVRQAKGDSKKRREHVMKT